MLFDDCETKEDYAKRIRGILCLSYSMNEKKETFFNTLTTRLIYSEIGSKVWEQLYDESLSVKGFIEWGDERRKELQEGDTSYFYVPHDAVTGPDGKPIEMPEPNVKFEAVEFSDPKAVSESEYLQILIALMVSASEQLKDVEFSEYDNLNARVNQLFINGMEIGTKIQEYVAEIINDPTQDVSDLNSWAMNRIEEFKRKDFSYFLESEIEFIGDEDEV